MRVLLFVLMSVFTLTVSAMEPSKYTPSEEDMMCLTQNIFFEARDQELVGQVSIAFVTLNRVDSWRYKNSICGVVRDGFKVNRRDCHFSWYCDDESDYPSDNVIERKAWEYAKIVAYTVVQNRDYIEDPTNGSTHYHSNKVNPWWAPKIAYLGTIGDHLFYVEGEPN